MNIRALNEQVLVVEFSGGINLENTQKVLALKKTIDQIKKPGVLESWTGYDTVAIAYDPAKANFEGLKSWVSSLEYDPDTVTGGKIHRIPVRYHLDSPDMIHLAKCKGLTPEIIASIHQEPAYIVAMLGFQPGFPFLIGLPGKLHHPRKSIPSPRVRAGSVAIGGSQTGIYPSPSAGGWHVIGETEVKLFTKPDQFLFEAGDQVKFVPLV